MSIDSITTLIAADKLLASLRKKIKSGKGTFSDTFRYSLRSSQLMGELFSGEVLGMPDEERRNACKTLLHDRYTDINALLDTVQRTLDKAQGLNLNPRHAPFDSERAAQIGDSLTDRTVPDETIQRRARSAPVTAARSMHDDFIEENASFRSKAGLQCYINRETDGKCCKWCTKLAGRYIYDRDIPQDVFRRHDNCGCSVTYECGRQRQNVWTKKTWEVPEADAGAPPPTVFTQEQARKLEQEKLAQIVHKHDASEMSEGGIIANVPKSDDKAQSYRPVVIDKEDETTTTRNYEVKAYKVETAQNEVYVSENCDIKPKKLHQIDRHISETLNKMGISERDNLPKVLLVSRKDMATNDVAVYRAIENQLLICEDLAVYKPQDMPVIMEQLACCENDLSSYVHELYHWLDAEEYRSKFGAVTEEKYDDYISFINSKAQNRLDKLAEKGYNILVSEYATRRYSMRMYYETYTEYRVKQLLKEG